MIVTMEVKVEEEEVLELVKAEVIRKIGPAPEGYHMRGMRYYGGVKVFTEKDTEPKPPQTSTDDVAAVVKEIATPVEL